MWARIALGMSFLLPVACAILRRLPQAAKPPRSPWLQRRHLGMSAGVPCAANLRKDAAEIMRSALDAADPRRSIRRAMRIENGVLELRAPEGDRRYELGSLRQILIVGFGKASAQMAAEVEDVLREGAPPEVFDGIRGVVVTKEGHADGLQLSKVCVREAAHPVPDSSGLKAAEEVAAVVRDAEEGTLILCCVSGGGSALLPAPADGLSLEDKQETTRLLLASGATIHETNLLRKHLSGVKGGRLAAMAHPARIESFVLSDVVGDDLDLIASGCTVPDAEGSTFEACLQLCAKYNLNGRLPARVMAHLQAGKDETPKAGDPRLEGARTILVGSNRAATELAAEKARNLGYHALVLSSVVEGEARQVAKVFAAIAKELRATQRPLPLPACIICGGETTVTLRGNGKGGRNQELALAAAIAAEGLEDTVIMSFGTDGTDGPTDAAGAVVDGQTVARAADLGLDAQDFLDRNDAYTFFDRVGGGALLKTGPTGTNVADVALVLVA